MLAGSHLKSAARQQLYVIHSTYANNPSGVNHPNFAIMMLQASFILSDSLNIVRLPRQADRGIDYENKVGKVAGWFVNLDNLLEAAVYAPSQSLCTDYVTGMPFENNLCVGPTYSFLFFTSNDVGGPFVLYESTTDPTPTLVGIMNIQEATWSSNLVYRVDTFLSLIYSVTGITPR